MKKIRLVTLFSGYDSQVLAMERLKRNWGGEFDYNLVAWCEIEPAAIKAHNALFPQWRERNLGDICKVDPNDVPDCDVLTYSFPCQDISNAGKQKGFEQDSGSRSSLLWECEKIIKAKRPQYLLMENVKALVQKKFMPEFQRWIDTLKNGTTKTRRAISKTACYKLAGNSIVVSCLYHLFRTMFIPNQPENENRKESKQYTIFDYL